jgi:hypothetical protein
MNIEQIARVCHEVNRAYCAAIGDLSQAAWEDAPEWQRRSAINGVQFHLENPDSKPEDSHVNWSREKIADGWVYGPVKDAEKKTHPCLVAYDQLPLEQRVKDSLFISVVRALPRPAGDAIDFISVMDNQGAPIGVDANGDWWIYDGSKQGWVPGLIYEDQQRTPLVKAAR